jgi:hypothetical protein
MAAWEADSRPSQMSVPMQHSIDCMAFPFPLIFLAYQWHVRSGQRILPIVRERQVTSAADRPVWFSWTLKVAPVGGCQACAQGEGRVAMFSACVLLPCIRRPGKNVKPEPTPCGDHVLARFRMPLTSDAEGRAPPSWICRLLRIPLARRGFPPSRTHLDPALVAPPQSPSFTEIANLRLPFAWRRRIPLQTPMANFRHDRFFGFVGLPRRRTAAPRAGGAAADWPVR